MINLPYKPRLSAMEIYDIYSLMAQAVVTTRRPSFSSHLKALVFEKFGYSLTNYSLAVSDKPTAQFCNCPLPELIKQGCQCGGV